MLQLPPVPIPPSRAHPLREEQAPHSRQAWAAALVTSWLQCPEWQGRVLSLLWPAHAGPGSQWGLRVGGGGPGQAPWDCTWAKEDKGLQGRKWGVSFLCHF